MPTQQGRGFLSQLLNPPPDEELKGRNPFGTVTQREKDFASELASIPGAMLKKFGSAISGQSAEAAELPPDFSSVTGSGSQLASAIEEAPDFSGASGGGSRLAPAVSAPPTRTTPPIARMRPGAILPMRGNAQPVDLEGGEPSINRLLSQATSYHEKSPNPGLSSTFDLGSLASLDNIIKEEPQVADVSNVTKDSFATLGGGDLVDSWNEVKTAQKELGSFSDSAGKWWSVALAAMFPQYGSALNLIGNMKSNKYRAAMDKYDTAFKSQRTPKHDVRGLGDGWYSMDGEVKQLPVSSTPKYETFSGRADNGNVLSKAVDVSKDYSSELTMPSQNEIYGFNYEQDVPLTSDQTFRTLENRRGIQEVAEETIEERAARDERQKQQKFALKQMGIDAAERAIRLRADLRSDIPAASDLVRLAYANDVDFLVSSGAKGVDMLTEATIKKADELKAARKARQGSGETPAPQGPATKGTGQQTTPATRVAH